jgi:hypothetical protein
MATFYETFGISEEAVAFLKKRFPAGTRVELIELDDPYNKKLTTGDRGTVRLVDDIGTIHVDWDCGSRLGLIYYEDDFKVIEEEGDRA